MSQTTNLNMIPQRNVRNLYFSQNDVGRVATVNLVDGGTPYSIPIGATVKIQATKPSGLGFSETCTFSGSTVTVTSTATMTDEAGIFPCEIQVTSGGTILGSANFNFFVERNPHPNGTTDGTAESVLNDITVAYNHAMDQIENAGGLTVAIKNALLNCFQKVAWIDEHGQDYYDALADELFAVTGITLNSSTLLFSSLGSTQQLTASLIPSTSTATVSWVSSDTSVATVSSSGLVTSVANGSATITASVGSVSATCSVSVSVATVTSISAVLNASGHTFYVGEPVDDIKPYLTVTATYSDSSTQTVPSGSYTLSGTLSQVGANTITVSYESVTTTVSVTCAAAELSYISAVYTQSGTVYDTDTLDSLKSDLVVTAHYSDTTTSTVASTDYTLSGTLTEGTSTITVTYLEKTTTFSVTVAGWTWKYKASDGQTLSQRTDLFNTGASAGTFSEVISDGLLHLTANNNGGQLYWAFNSPTTNTNAMMEMKIKYAQVSYASTYANLQIQLSNGTGGAKVGASKQGGNNGTPKFATIIGTTNTLNPTITIGDWYVVKILLENGKQSVYINDTPVIENQNLCTSYCLYNRIFMQSPNDNTGSPSEVYIDYIAYKNGD